MYKKFFKRFFDVVLAISGLVILFPVSLTSALILLFSNNGKIFFLQERPGKNGKIFYIIKFKTMNDKKDIHGNLLPNVDRLTKAGKIIRKLSIDEIPQLLNVIKGDMSLIGPRPLLVDYLPLYNETQKQRHNICPGITGWAQVNGRNAISWEEKFKLDVWYVNNVTLALDIKIMWMTFIKVFKSEGVNSGTNVIMEKFEGNNK